MAEAAGAEREPLGWVALHAWLEAGVAPPWILFSAITIIMSRLCSGGGECSWGFELLIVIPVLFCSHLWWGPKRIGTRLRRVGLQEPSSRSAVRRARLAGVTAIGVLYASAVGGGISILITLVTCSIVVPLFSVRGLDESASSTPCDA